MWRDERCGRQQDEEEKSQVKTRTLRKTIRSEKTRLNAKGAAPGSNRGKNPQVQDRHLGHPNSSHTIAPGPPAV
jgi:hypothetical protein